MEMKGLIDRIHSDTKVLESHFLDTFLNYFRYSLHLTTLILKEGNNLRQDYLNNKLFKHYRVFRNFCQLFAPLQKVTEVEIMYDDNAYEISLNYEGDLFLNNEEVLLYVKYYLHRKKLEDFKGTIVGVVNEDFKKFIEHVKDLYRKSVRSESDFLQQEKRLKELEEKFEEFRIEVLKDTVWVYGEIIRRKYNKFKQLVTQQT